MGSIDPGRFKWVFVENEVCASKRAGGSSPMGTANSRIMRQGWVVLTIWLLGQVSVRAEDAEPCSPANLAATVLHILLGVSEMRLRVDIPAGIKHMLDLAGPLHMLDLDQRAHPLGALSSRSRTSTTQASPPNCHGSILSV